jgi:hypothetical protein
LIHVIFSIVERIDKNVSEIFYTSALNKKLGTEGLNVSEIAVEAGKRGLNVSQVAAMVEQDAWRYKGFYHDGKAMVCSSFVASLWKAAGLFDFPVNGVEWHPRDVYEVDLFDKNYTRPQQCVEADPDAQYCQIVGKWRMNLPGTSSIPAYAHMNEHCPSRAPDYVRPEGC